MCSLKTMCVIQHLVKSVTIFYTIKAVLPHCMWGRPPCLSFFSEIIIFFLICSYLSLNFKLITIYRHILQKLNCYLGFNAFWYNIYQVTNILWRWWFTFYIDISREKCKPEQGIEPWTSCTPSKHSIHYTIQIQERGLLKISFMKCLKAPRLWWLDDLEYWCGHNRGEGKSALNLLKSKPKKGRRTSGKPRCSGRIY